MEPDFTPRGNMNSIKMNKIWGPWATLGWGLLIFIVWSLAQAVPLMVAVFSHLLQNGGKGAASLITSLTKNGCVISLSISFGSMVAFGLLWLIIVFRKGAKLPEYLGFYPLKIKTLLWVAGIAAGFWLASDLLTYFLGKDIVDTFEIESYSTRGNLALLILGMNLMGPLFEEIYFRGFLFEGLRNSRLGNVGTVLLVTVAWASLHIQYDAYEVAIVFVSGLAMAYLRLKTSSLWSSIFFHLLMNFWSTIETVLYFHGFMFLHLSKA